MPVAQPNDSAYNGTRGSLQGQTQASADRHGNITFTGLTLEALPGFYNISAVLPGKPPGLCFCVMTGQWVDGQQASNSKQ